MFRTFSSDSHRRVILPRRTPQNNGVVRTACTTQFTISCPSMIYVLFWSAFVCSPYLLDDATATHPAKQRRCTHGMQHHFTGRIEFLYDTTTTHPAKQRRCTHGMYHDLSSMVFWGHEFVCIRFWKDDATATHPARRRRWTHGMHHPQFIETL